jgi:hypothetical protein
VENGSSRAGVKKRRRAVENGRGRAGRGREGEQWRMGGAEQGGRVGEEQDNKGRGKGERQRIKNRTVEEHRKVIAQKGEGRAEQRKVMERKKFRRIRGK